jgi:hypothetical protein
MWQRELAFRARQCRGGEGAKDIDSVSRALGFPGARKQAQALDARWGFHVRSGS